ncbi:MAG: hypothetical protein KDB35_23845 [Acidimicrobiales bacterium]|nr:hypothetical protein [Acidimicrobiales bacterium]
MTTQAAAPAGHYTVLGQRREMTHEARCRTCNHERRGEIDGWLLEGEPPAAIARRLGPSAPSPSSLSRHGRKHLPVDLVARAALTRERAGSDGVNLDGAVEELVSARRLAHMLAAKGAEALLDGSIQPTSFLDVVRAVDLLVRVEALAGEDDSPGSAKWALLALTVTTEVVKRVAPPEVWDEISETVRNDPTVVAMGRFYDGMASGEHKAVLIREIAELGFTSDRDIAEITNDARFRAARRL